MFDPKSKMLKDERILVLEQIPGKNATTDNGLVDNRLFKGENTLRAIRDMKTSIWYMKYEFGGLPEPLKQKFTRFDLLLNHATKYFLKRGVRIAKVID